MGLLGSKGETRLKGEKAGTKNAKGEPSELIAALLLLSTWSKLEGKSEKILTATTDRKLILPNAAASDSSVYKCSASNILGQAQELVRPVVNGKFHYVNRLCWFANRSNSNSTLRPSN